MTTDTRTRPHLGRVPRRVLVVLGLLLALLVLLAWSDRAAAQGATPSHPVASASSNANATIVGVVVDTAGEPVTGALVTVIGQRLQVFTNDRGHFAIPQIPPELQVIAVRRVGYEARYLDVRFVPGELVQMGVELRPLPHQLEIVTVYGKAYKPERLAYTTRFDDFYARRARGDGHFFTREEMLEGGGSDIIQVFRRVPGLRIDGQGWSQWVSIPGCPGPYVFVDGSRVSMGVYALQDLRVTELEGVEVYKNAASVPPEAAGSCAAIMIWTRGRQ